MCSYGIGALHNQVLFENLNYGNHFIYLLSPCLKKKGSRRREAFGRNKHISLGNCQKKTGGWIDQIHKFVRQFCFNLFDA